MKGSDQSLLTNNSETGTRQEGRGDIYEKKTRSPDTGGPITKGRTSHGYENGHKEDMERVLDRLSARGRVTRHL